MNAAAVREVQAPEVRINWDALGAFFYNPHPPGPENSFTEIGGIKYPFGTQGVIVTGKHYVIAPKGLGHIQADDPNYKLVIDNINTVIGQYARNDMGVRRIYLDEAEKEGPTYFEKIDRVGANVICQTIRRTVVDGLVKENESRAQRHIPPREFDHNEQRMIVVLEGLSDQLDTRKAHDLHLELEGIREAAREMPDFAEALAALPIQQLKRKAKLAGIVVGPNMTKNEIIRVIQERKAVMLQQTDPGVDPDVLAAAEAQKKTAPASQPRRTTGEDIPEPGEDVESLMNETVSVDEGTLDGSATTGDAA